MAKKPVRRPNTHRLQLAPLVIALAVLVLGIIAGAAWQRKSDTTPIHLPSIPSQEPTDYLFVQTATGGTFTSANSEMGMYILALNNVSPRVLLYRKGTKDAVGSTNLETFLDKFNTLGKNNSSDATTNAILITHDTNEGHEEAVALQLSQPTYDRDLGTLIFRTKIIGSADKRTLEVLHDKDISSFPEQFNDPVLFIDTFNTASGL